MQDLTFQSRPRSAVYNVLAAIFFFAGLLAIFGPLLVRALDIGYCHCSRPVLPYYGLGTLPPEGR